MQNAACLMDHQMIPILYEDATLIFVDKPAGMVVQRGYDADEPVVLEIVNEYLRAKGEQAILMQRLDRGTSGVLFFSKDPAMNAKLTRQFEQPGLVRDGKQCTADRQIHGVVGSLVLAARKGRQAYAERPNSRSF